MHLNNFLYVKSSIYIGSIEFFCTQFSFSWYWNKALTNCMYYSKNCRCVKFNIHILRKIKFRPIGSLVLNVFTDISLAGKINWKMKHSFIGWWRPVWPRVRGWKLFRRWNNSPPQHITISLRAWWQLEGLLTTWNKSKL